MVNIKLYNNRVHEWKKYPRGYVKGYAFDDMEALTEDDIYKRCLDAYARNDLPTLLRMLNGHFSVVLHWEEDTVLIADKLKTYPLFYFQTSGGYTIADLGDTVMEELDRISLNPLAVKEYLAAGYVSGNKTLLRGCSIVPAASYVHIRKEGKAKVTYYYSQHSLSPIEDTARIAPEMNGILERVMRRMKETTKKRPIVIPLSGGYDSRLIACLCKKYEVPNVICYSYGISDSPEKEVSRKVAERLSFPWFYVEYTAEKWERLIDSPLFEEYLRYGGNLNTIPHIQDLLAIKELLENKVISKETVVVPGHTGDVLGGSHLPANINKYTIGKALYEKYFEVHILKRKYRKELIDYLDRSVRAYFPIHTKEDCLQAFQTWNIRTRQANFIINSVRAYELNGLDWYLPLWDDEFERFWSAIPCLKRIDSRLYNDYLFKEFFEPYRVDYRKPSFETAPSLPIRWMKGLFSHSERYLIKNFLSRLGLYTFPKERNALDIAGEIIQRKDFKKKNEYICLSKTNSMCMKSLYYLSLLSGQERL